MIVPISPPQAVPLSGGFDYVHVDAAHRRVYAAHSGASTLLIVDADTGKVQKQINVGPMHGVAVNPADAHVFTGNGDVNTISESDPVSGKVLRTVHVAGPVDAIAFDPSNGHIYGDEDDGTRVFVIDAKTFKPLETVALPGHKPEYLAVDPATHDVYQNISDLAEIAVIDGTTLKVKRIIKTPELTGNHPLQFDPQLDVIVAGGQNGVMSEYAPDGTKKFSIDGLKRFDQCDLDATTHILACAGGGGLTLIQLAADAAPKVIGEQVVSPGIHTVGIDPQTHHIWAVFATAGGSAFVQGFSNNP